MDEKDKIDVTDEELKAAFVRESPKDVKKEEKGTKKPKSGKKYTVLMIIGIFALIAGAICLLVAFLGLKNEKEALSFPDLREQKTTNTEYSLLTGEPMADKTLKNAPVFCMQTPNGMDGARPQSGLTEAGVVFEAIAEAGITRFAAIYQNPSAAVIGPIRSLRIYYLEWDTPFDCTIVHAGGAADALAAVSSGYRNLDESYQYMYRGTYRNRLWNNLFTTASLLKQFNKDHGYETSDVKGFARLTPEESEQARINNLAEDKLNIAKPSKKDTSVVSAKVSSIALRMGGLPNFNIRYNYEAKTNTYLRSFESGAKHEVYACSNEDLGEKNPEDVCTLTQLAPSVVIAMVVQESKAADNYHEDIKAIGSGNAYIFQNGDVIKGTWQKASRGDQIKFADENGKEVKLAPGQTFITAVPAYGSVEF